MSFIISKKASLLSKEMIIILIIGLIVLTLLIVYGFGHARNVLLGIFGVI